MKKLLVSVNGIKYDVEVEIIEDDEQRLSPHGMGVHPSYHPHVPVAAPSPMPIAPMHPKAKAEENKDSKVLTSPIPGIVLKVNVIQGVEVQINQPLLVIEAMKMETNISSPVSGKVKEIKVKAGDNVLQEQVLVTLE